MLDLSDYPRFSLEERDRRWRRARELMRAAGCDCIVAPGMRDLQEQTTSRYLCQIGGVGYSAWVVFPLEGEPTAIVDSDRNREFAMRAGLDPGRVRGERGRADSRAPPRASHRRG